MTGYTKKVYNFLLDNLRVISGSYHVNDSGIVVNVNNEKEVNEYIINNTKFYAVYCMAYKEFAELYDNYPINEITDGFIKRALSDYTVFNSFINNCVFEYIMYNDIGTGYIIYYPVDSLANYFFKNNDRKKVLLDYLNCELRLNNKEEKSGVKK